MLKQLNERAQAILKMVVEEYVVTGEPLGSRRISRKLEQKLSSASVRNVLADLQDAGLVCSPHTSAGRLPTYAGLRLFVEGILESGNIDENDRHSIEKMCFLENLSVHELMTRAAQIMAGLSRCAGLVAVPTGELTLKHLEFVPLNLNKVMAVIVMQNGVVENIVFDMPIGIPTVALIEAGNYLSTKMSGYPLSQAMQEVRKDIASRRQLLSEKTQAVVDTGLARFADHQAGQDCLLIVSGQKNLLEQIGGMQELEQIRCLFEMLESKENMLKILESLEQGEGVRIFIGAENELFSLSGCSMVTASHRDSNNRVVGTLGVIGPSRMNYARIIPMVDYTTKVIDHMGKQV